MKIASAPQDRSAGRILAIASGKGGVGKTMLSIGMARAFSQMGERCLLMDGDLGMANIDVQLGLQPTALEHRLPCFLELLCQSIHLSQRLAAQPHFLLVSVIERHRLLLILLLPHHVTPRRKHEGQLRLQDP